jgi:nucleotide-binding universal stress UspA family protein
VEDWDVKTILLGFDGSEGAGRAADLAAALARKFGATVVIVSCFKRHLRTIEMGEKAFQEIQEANEWANQEVERLTDMGIPADKVVREGPAALAIVSMAESRQADLIVLGSRGRNSTSARLLGSTSEKVARGAAVPVLVAR